jgi:hypothetical protein
MDWNEYEKVTKELSEQIDSLIMDKVEVVEFRGLTIRKTDKVYNGYGKDENGNKTDKVVYKVFVVEVECADGGKEQYRVRLDIEENESGNCDMDSLSRACDLCDEYGLC